jgi:hypothetical protein
MKKKKEKLNLNIGMKIMKFLIFLLNFVILVIINK